MSYTNLTTKRRNKEMEQLPIDLRIGTVDDAPFVFNSWLKSFRSSTFAKQISNTIYYHDHHIVIEKLLKNNDVIIACSKSDPNQLYGFICAGQTDGIFTLHYIYVKHPFRRMGIAKALFNAFEHDPSHASIYTHRTKAAEKLQDRYNMVHHPYIALGSHHEKKDETPQDND